MDWGKKKLNQERDDIIYILTIILFKYKSDMSYVKAALEDLKNSYPLFLPFCQYYENNWYYYLENAMLDYSKISKL